MSLFVMVQFMKIFCKVVRLKMGEILNKYMEMLDRHRYFNGAVLVAKKGEVLLSKGYGYADYNHNIPNTSSTKLRIGSLTKAFTAMAILILHD